MRWNRIRTKLITFLLIATIIPTIVTIIATYVYTSNSLKTRAVEDNVQLMYQGTQNISNLLDNLNRSSLMLYNDFDFYRMLERSYDDPKMEALTYTALQNISLSMRDIWQVYLYRSDLKRSTLLFEGLPRRQYESAPFSASRRYGRLEASIEPTHSSSSYGYKQSALPYYYPSAYVFTLHRPIIKSPSTEELGILSIDVKLEALSVICERLYTKGEEHLYLIDRNNRILYTDNLKLLGQRLSADWLDNVDYSLEPSGHFEHDQSLFVYDSIPSPIAELTLIKQIPQQHLLREATAAVQFNMILLLISLLLTIIATIWISVRITNPIHQLMHYIRQVQDGNLQADIEVASRDEIGIVSQRLRNMMDMINNLILREYKLELANKTSQLKVLQAQINPHFINNALQSIGTLALKHQAPQIYSLVTALAKMMRYSMYTEQSSVTLAAEIEHVNSYIKLQKQRFLHTFEAVINADPTTLNILIPKMTLQPLVENYFKHGLDRSSQAGLLNISTRWIAVHTVEIIVDDNGYGIAADKLNALNSRLGQAASLHIDSSEQTNPIGLHNVNTRLQLFSKQQASIRLEANQPRGTKVILQIKVVSTDESIDRG